MWWPWLAACLVLAGAAQQAAVALGWLEIGDEPGAEAPGRVLLTLAFLALVSLGLTFLWAAAVGERVPAAPVLAVAAGLLVIARFYAFDPYYAPFERRMSDGGAVAGMWIVLVVACAIAAAAAAVRLPRAGLVVTAVVGWLAFGTAASSGLGH